MPGEEGGVVQKDMQGHTVRTLAQHYRQHGEQTVIVCVLMHYLQPNMSVGIQEVIIICVPEGMRYNKM